VKRVLGFLFVLTGASFAAAVGNPNDAVPAQRLAQHLVAPKDQVAMRLAPADEYFGPLKMSVLGIRNVIHDLTIRYEPTYDYDHHLAKSIMGTALMTEASLRDWEKKYPADDQLARAVYFLQRLYAKIQLDDAQAKAKICASWLTSRYVRTWYAKNMRVTLQRAPGQPPASTPGGAGTGTGTTTTPPGITTPAGTTTPLEPVPTAAPMQQPSTSGTSQ
jgi:hypothetical protein